MAKTNYNYFSLMETLDIRGALTRSLSKHLDILARSGAYVCELKAYIFTLCLYPEGAQQENPVKLPKCDTMHNALAVMVRVSWTESKHQTTT